MARILFDTSTQLAANAVFLSGTAGNGGQDGIGEGAGQARDAGTVRDSNRFGVIVHTDQAGTVAIEGAFTAAGPWRQSYSNAVAANTPIDADIPVRFRFYRVRYINGGAQTGAGNFTIHSSFRSGQ